MCFISFRLVSVREKNRKVALYSIQSNPLASYEFCVSGRDEFVRIYDARKLSTTTVPVSPSGSADSSPDESVPTVKRFCPQHLIDSRAKAHVTCAVYNYNGKEVLGSYNDENIYLFDATHSDMADCIKVYEGHRNSATGNSRESPRVIAESSSLFIYFVLHNFSERSKLFWRS